MSKRPVHVQAQGLPDLTYLGFESQEGVLLAAQKMVIALNGVELLPRRVAVEKRPHRPKELRRHHPRGDAVKPIHAQERVGLKGQRKIHPGPHPRNVEHPGYQMGVLGPTDQIGGFRVMQGINEAPEILVAVDGFTAEGIFHSPPDEAEKTQVHLRFNRLVLWKWWRSGKGIAQNQTGRR